VFRPHPSNFTTRAVTNSCPTKDVLRDFNDGRIGDTQLVDRISEHLGTCDKCIATLESMDPDPLAQGLRVSLVDELGDDDELGDPALDELSDSYEDLMSSVSTHTASWKSEPSRALAEHRYRVLASIGEGSFGRMFLAALDSEEMYAVKIPHPKQLISRLHHKQFLADCERAASLQHPNVHPLVNYGFWDEQRMFFATRYVESPTLTDIARNTGDIPINKAILIFTQVSEAIRYAHRAGIIHRHLNPDNILLENWDFTDQPNVLVTDFGFTFDSRYQFELVETKHSPTPFDSPESANNVANFIDPRADIFSLGKILKLLLRIARPRQEKIAQMLTGIVDKSTSPKRRGRYKSVDELLAALGQVPMK